MSICIASVCDKLSAIISVSDTRAATEDGFIVDDRVGKHMWLARTWRAMATTEDTSEITPIVATIQELLRQAESDPPQDFKQIQAACEKAYHEYWLWKINCRVLKRFKIDYDSYIAGGGAFTDAQRINIDSEIVRFDTELLLLVFGFGPERGRSPHVGTVDSPGCMTWKDDQGFWAVGSEATKSWRHMSATNPSMLPIAEAIARLCEAKFIVENDKEIGSTTFVTVLYPDEELALHQPEIEDLKRVWNKSAQPMDGKQFRLAAECAEAALGKARPLQGLLREQRARREKIHAAMKPTS